MAYAYVVPYQRLPCLAFFNILDGHWKSLWALRDCNDGSNPILVLHAAAHAAGMS